MSAATSRANSRTPSRGTTQDLEALEAVSPQPPQIAPKSADPQMPHATASKQDTKSAMLEGPSGTAPQDSAPSKPVAEGHAQSSQQQLYPDDWSEFAEILAAQPLRSSSSAAIPVQPPLAQGLSQTTLKLSPAIQPQQGPAQPVAEGTEARQPAKSPATARSSSTAKEGPGCMSGVSTGRGASAQVLPRHTAAAGAVEASSSQQPPLMLPGALVEDTTDLQR